jgi:hypothetical protein
VRSQCGQPARTSRASWLTSTTSHGCIRHPPTWRTEYYTTTTTLPHLVNIYHCMLLVPDGRMVRVEALHVALLLAAEGRGGREGRGGEGAPHLVEAEGGQAAVLPLPHPVVGGQRAARGGGGAPQPVHLHQNCFVIRLSTKKKPVLRIHEFRYGTGCGSAFADPYL